MARRSKAAGDSIKQAELIRNHLDTFLRRLENDDLRSQVLSLIPVFHSLRDLGSGLIDPSDEFAARDRILAYFQKYPHMLIDGDELLVVSGIGEWARRLRELRKEFGWVVFSGYTLRDEALENESYIEEIELEFGFNPTIVKPDQYILMSVHQDREAALRWNQLNGIRKKKTSVKNKLLEYLRLNVGAKVTGEELRYLAKNNKEWARRTRELRTEDGWPVVTRMQGRPDLAVGEYLLEEDRQTAKHDRKISDSVRAAVLERDNFSCTHCGWNRDKAHPDDPRKFLELHHIEDHVIGGENAEFNLTTLCNVHHDDVHALRLKWENSNWVKYS